MVDVVRVKLLPGVTGHLPCVPVREQPVEHDEHVGNYGSSDDQRYRSADNSFVLIAFLLVGQNDWVPKQVLRPYF